MSALIFPDGFLWGVATSSHQIEGAFHEGGRGESIWDRFAATPGRIADGSDASVACDHYHRWRDDIALMQWMGVGAYRFSIAWPRVMPQGVGAVNAAGLDFYDAVVDALLERGIQPFVTLYHWDLPQTLQDAGGWGKRRTAEAFVEYTDAVTRRLGDRVRHWMTHNEPWCVAHLGHEDGEHAPGHRNAAEALSAAHHLLLSHGWACETIRRNAPGAEAGIVLNLSPAFPATESRADRDAARWFDGFFNRWYLDPIFRGQYPADAVEDRIARGDLHSPAPGFVRPGDMKTISTPLDFLGVNYYSRTVLRAGAGGEPEAVRPPGATFTDMGWEVHPPGLRDALARVWRDYRPTRLYVTEKGAAWPEGPDATGRVHDERRVAYLQGHLQAAHDALLDGVPLAGYFVWSLLDNFEWAHGFTKRFGLYWVDFATGNRLPKQSAFWYREQIAANAADDRPPSLSPRTVP
jgi:beta-glucosidase